MTHDDRGVLLMTGMWALLPTDVLRCVAAHCDELNLLALCNVSRAFRAVADDAAIWLERIQRQHRQVVEVLFDGRVPEPAVGHNWKMHYFHFSVAWKALAMQRHPGRLLLVISSAEVACGQAANRLREKTYGVYDVTEYVYEHPGADLLLVEASEERDASELFQITSHSERARRRLRLLVVRGLEALPYDEDPYTLRRRRRRWQRWSQPLRAILPQDAKVAGITLVKLIVLVAVVARGMSAVPASFAAVAAHGFRAFADAVEAALSVTSAPHCMAGLVSLAFLGRWSCHFCAALVSLHSAFTPPSPRLQPTSTPRLQPTYTPHLHPTYTPPSPIFRSPRCC